MYKPVKNFIKWLPAFILPAFSACQDSEWDDHYGIGSGSTQNLMEVLEGNADYSRFCEQLKAHGLDTLLASDQTYTVWAPTNDAMGSYTDDGDAVDHFIKNHINRYVYNLTDLTDTAYVRIKMLNGKFQDYQRGTGGYSFAGVGVAGDDLMAANGVIHGIGSVAPFYLNIYESIRSDNNTDSLARYLEQFDVYTFDRANSSAIGKNGLGQLVYDSVFTYTSRYMQNYGDLWLEDSLYTMIVPTNTGWNAGYEATKPYFRTFGALQSSSLSTINVPTRSYATADALADSLTDAYTKENMAQNLVFRGRAVPSAAPGDSLVATSGNVFHHPVALFAGANGETVSNGIIWKTDVWNYKPEDCFLKKIVVEAENTQNRTDAYANVFSRSSSSTTYADSVSEQKYIEVNAATTNARTQPMVQFAIPNTLAATYDVYCVFAPAEAYSAEATPDSTRVRFYLNYVHEDGRMHEDAAINGTVTNGRAMTKMFVARITLPYANFSSSVFDGDQTQDDDCVRLRVQTNVASSETTRLSRTMRIDCIIFEPVTE